MAIQSIEHLRGKLRGFKLGKTGAIVALLCAAVAVFMVVFCLIAFTPLRTFIPGYPDSGARKVAADNAIKVDSLENTITRLQLYTENLARILEGREPVQVDSILDVRNINVESLRASLMPGSDSLLRVMIADEQGSPASDEDVTAKGLHFSAPLKGTIAKGFDNAGHPGVDISAPANTVVKSVLDGTVVFTGWDDLSGYTMVIQHKDNIISVYKHNQKLLKGVGDAVPAGTPVATVGESSEKDGEHLYLEIWSSGKAIDPAKYISF